MPRVVRDIYFGRILCACSVCMVLWAAVDSSEEANPPGPAPIFLPKQTVEGDCPVSSRSLSFVHAASTVFDALAISCVEYGSWTVAISQKPIDNRSTCHDQSCPSTDDGGLLAMASNPLRGYPHGVACEPAPNGLAHALSVLPSFVCSVTSLLHLC